MKRIYWILTSISLYSLLSCSNGAKDTQEYQTVKTDTVISAGGQTSLQYPGKVKNSASIVGCIIEDEHENLFLNYRK